MKSFKELGIKPETKGMIGPKIEIFKILNCPIIVHKHTVEDSKFDTGKCLNLQIEFENEMRVVFTGSANLIKMIGQVPADAFPFKTTIIKDNRRLEFT